MAIAGFDRRSFAGRLLFYCILFTFGCALPLSASSVVVAAGGNTAQNNARPNSMAGQTSAGTYSALPTLRTIFPGSEIKQNLSVSALCHMLLYYGTGNTDLTVLPQGVTPLKALTDENAAIKVFGKSPFIRSPNGIRYYVVKDPLSRANFGETH